MLSRPYAILQSPSTPSPHLPLIPPFTFPSIPRVGTGSDNIPLNSYLLSNANTMQHTLNLVNATQ